MLNIIGHLVVAIPGAVFGAALGFRLVVTVQDPVIVFNVIAASTILCAFLSMKPGLRFWEEIGRLRWVGPL